jgi:hypothetical protein
MKFESLVSDKNSFRYSKFNQIEITLIERHIGRINGAEKMSPIYERMIKM